MFGLGTTEIIVIALVVIVLFGAKRLPQLGSSMGKAITNFKKGVSDAGNTIEKDTKSEDKES